MVFLCKNDVAFGTVIKIFRLQFFSKHSAAKIRISDLFQSFNCATDGFCFLLFGEVICNQGAERIF